MGQANNRGTFVERQQAAYDRIDSAHADLTEHVAQLDVMDTEAQAMMQSRALQFVAQYWKYSDIESRMLPYVPELVLTGMPNMVMTNPEA